LKQMTNVPPGTAIATISHPLLLAWSSSAANGAPLSPPVTTEQ